MPEAEVLSPVRPMPAAAQRWTHVCVDFVRSIGLRVDLEPTSESEFMPYVRVHQGGLKVDPEHAFPGDILHEAGHIAVVPQQFRHLADGQLEAVTDAMGAYLNKNGDGLARYPEDPLCRACLQADEQSATAWQYAAAHHLGLPDKWLFPKGSFEGESADVLSRLKASAHMGINGLQAANWTLVRAYPARNNLPVYPKLAFWLSP